MLAIRYPGLGTFRLPAHECARVGAMAEETLFASCYVGPHVDPAVLLEIQRRGLYGKYEARRNRRAGLEAEGNMMRIIEAICGHSEGG